MATEGTNMKKRKINPFVVAYVMVLIGLAVTGYILSDYTIRNEAAHKAAITNKNFATDIGFLDLPRINTSLPSGAAGRSGHLRMDITLKVEQKNLPRIEDFEPKITDRIVSYVQRLDMEDMQEKDSLPQLRKELLRQVNSASYPVPVIDIVFQEVVVL